jgi:hypothetical protein
MLPNRVENGFKEAPLTRALEISNHNALEVLYEILSQYPPSIYGFMKSPEPSSV